MTIDKTQFGKPITHDDADLLFDRFIKIKTRSCDKIRDALAGDFEAIRYYCGRTGGVPANEDQAYVFTKESLTAIMNNILAGKADGMILFNGARGWNDSLDENGTPTDVSGRPTLIMFPFYFKTGDDQITPGGDGDLIPLLDDGDEHPGTGTNGQTLGLKPLAVVSITPLPAAFSSGDIYPEV